MRPEHIEDVRDNRQLHAEHGVLVDPHFEGSEPIEAHPELRWNRIRHFFRSAFSEFLGTFILVMFGDGAIAMTTLSGGDKGNWLTICLGYG